MDNLLQRSHDLKQALSDFVLDAEGELATALETFSAEQLTRSQQQDMHQRTMVVDRFIVEGEVSGQTPIDVFLKEHADLSQADRELITNWKRSIVGLFAIEQILEDGFELRNWTTEKRYRVKPTHPQALKDMQRLKLEEIVLTQIAPLNDTEWIFFSPWTSLGRLGKPKLAVAIGNFKNNYKNHLYSDAPDLLEEAWKSVERYHQDFLEFFGSDEITLSGYELSKKLAEFQQTINQKNFDAAGIDRSKSLEDLAEEAGISQEELEEAAEEMGTDTKTIAQAWEKQAKTKMVASSVELPANLKKAERVTAMSHPRWGQMFLPSYASLQDLLETETEPIAEKVEPIVRRNLEDSEMNAFVWYRLAQRYPQQLEAVLRAGLQRPTFDLQSDLDKLLQEFNKPLEPELPEIASVPLHLHNLFQDAVVEVQKNKSKSKSKKKKTAGFQR
ncbi:MAG: hypothetical protein Kow00121_25130 [Elainellaceae cyanobacterium]